MKSVQRDHRACGGPRCQARTLKAALEHHIGARVPADARCWLVKFAGIRDEQVRHRQRRKDTAAQAAWAKGQHTDPGFRREGLVFSGQTSKKRKAGTAIPSRSVCWHAELVVRGSGCHRARAGDQETRSERQENSRVGEIGRGHRILEMRAVPWSPDGSDNAFDIQVGMERPAKVVPRSPREVLMENKSARTCLRRADFERWCSVKVFLSAST